MYRLLVRQRNYTQHLAFEFLYLPPKPKPVVLLLLGLEWMPADTYTPFLLQVRTLPQYFVLKVIGESVVAHVSNNTRFRLGMESSSSRRTCGVSGGWRASDATGIKKRCLAPSLPLHSDVRVLASSHLSSSTISAISGRDGSCSRSNSASERVEYAAILLRSLGYAQPLVQGLSAAPLELAGLLDSQPPEVGSQPRSNTRDALQRAGASATLRSHLDSLVPPDSLTFRMSCERVCRVSGGLARHLLCKGRDKSDRQFHPPLRFLRIVFCNLLKIQSFSRIWITYRHMYDIRWLLIHQIEHKIKTFTFFRRLRIFLIFEINRYSPM